MPQQSESREVKGREKRKSYSLHKNNNYWVHPQPSTIISHPAQPNPSLGPQCQAESIGVIIYLILVETLTMLVA